mmetsp:Transcript_24780/g.46604  ORF Transcript_24780/g.46604 Transcript_24780/m.46604 type:complete len:203 (-) Transcript_24780:19-627(-)
MSMTTASSSSLSTPLVDRTRTFPVPRSPVTENLTPSLVTAMVQVSPRTWRSVMMRLNSLEGMRMVVLYSVSGMPRWSASMSMSLSSKSLILSWFLLSNMRVKLSAESSALRVIMSVLSAHLRIFPRFWELKPREMLRSQRKWSKPSERRATAQRDTWEESMAWMERPSSLQSMLASVTRSLRASRSFLRIDPLVRRASNMVN